MHTTTAPAATPRFVTLRKAARQLGVRDQLAAWELLHEAEADIRRNYLGDMTVAEADLQGLIQANADALASLS